METQLLAHPLESLYDLIGRSRRRLGAISGVLLPFRSDNSVGRVSLGLCGFLALLALASNVNSIVRITERDDDVPSMYLAAVERVARIFQVSQHWYLFAPVPSHFQRKFEILAHLNDGSARDLMGLLSTPLFRARADGTGFDFLHPRWLKYFNQSDTFTDSEWLALGRYLCRRAQEQSLELAKTHHPTIEVNVVTQTIAHGAPPDPATVSRHLIDCAV
jgi:hypothetical protein